MAAVRWLRDTTLAQGVADELNADKCTKCGQKCGVKCSIHCPSKCNPHINQRVKAEQAITVLGVDYTAGR